ncbi:putative arabinan endo-1,5-alpha-L-arabinosidase A [Madurella mycetomatis]|uniref:Arabinan endo-1,5-alpha-L-arabinosidase n=1 Tax=Madurella mycetomatis TaxID=100816 RepID=A0A175VW90_9PEZI|nr:putative arabinan endo-1,5-alpha-L-arabinosidase A [Madurella mycetomatis]KXX76030.1 putative arabinan endo-1,5-alpha-L-arabinosidase A [Madurella mycetomatis]
MTKISILAQVLTVVPGLVAGYALPEACSGICTNTHDPSIIRRPDGTYFRFSTGGRIAVHTAPDLTGPWTYRGAVVPRGSSINLPGNQDLWAPDVSLVGNEYYLYYSVSTFGSQSSAIGLARSSSMDVGTWTDLGAIGVTSSPGKPYNAIDGNLISVDGTYYLTFGSWWDGIHQVQMSGTPTAVNPGSSAVQLSFDNGDRAMEGPNIFKHGGYYYLFFSKGSCCGYDSNRPAPGKEYRILACRSTSATGGFVDRAGRSCRSGGGTMVLESHNWVYGPGGQGVYQDPTYGPVLYYHYVDTRIGYADGQKRFGWNRLDFSSGWPVV